MAESRATPEQDELSEQSLGEARGQEEKEEKEDEVYTLLFHECDSQGEGMVKVDSLVDYLRRMQLGVGKKGAEEEVYDSQEDIHQLHYNLQLLRAMLECSAVDGRVDQATYSHVIRLWVKDVRDRSSQATPSLEVSQLSDSEEEDGVSLTQERALSFGAEESFETSGGNSSTHSTLDKSDLLGSLQDLRLDNRRLADQNQQLQHSLSHSEAQIKGMQTESTALQKQLRGLQQQLGRLESVERVNTELEEAIQEERKRCEELGGNTEKLSRQLDELLREVSSLRSQVSVSEGERERLEEESSVLRTLLLNKEDMLSQQNAMCEKLQSQLERVTSEADELRAKVEELAESNEALRSENVELHSTVQLGTPGPASSTPSHSGPPSLLDELSRHSNLTGKVFPSPLVGKVSESCRLEDRLDSSLTQTQQPPVEELESIAQHSSSKFHTKTEMMMQLLSELMSSPTSPPRTSTPHSKIIREKSTEIVQGSRPKEGNIRQLVSCVKKLYGEKKQLKQQVSDLQAQLRQLQEREEVDVGIQTTPPARETTPPVIPAAPLKEERATQTLPSPKPRPPQPSPPPSLLRRAGSLVWAVLRGVTLLLFLLLLLLLLLLALVLIQDGLHTCGSCCPMSPNGLIYSVIEPYVQVTRSAHTPI